MPTKVDLYFDSSSPTAPLSSTNTTGVKLSFERSPAPPNQKSQIHQIFFEEAPLSQISGVLANDELDFLKWILAEIRLGYKMMVETLGKGGSVGVADRANIDYTIQCLQRGLQQHLEAVFYGEGGKAKKEKQKDGVAALEDLFEVLTVDEEDRFVRRVEDLLDGLKI